MQEPIEALEARLAEREQLVAALTERLEQAAEQLDRLHRTGADRGPRVAGVGIPAELVAQQQKLTEDLQRAIEQWEALQPGAFFGRLETQLGQIHDLVSRSEGNGSRHGGGEGGYGSGSSHHAEERESDSGMAGYGVPRSGGSNSPTSLLDFLKGSHSSESEPAESAPESSSGRPPAVVDIALPPLTDPPEPIDPSEESPAELRRACEVRDSYIVYLLQRLRQIESLGHVPNSWAGLENVPEELRSQLEALEKRLQETLRLAEVELSLQRAKLAREELRIRTLDEQMQKELKRAREASDDHATDEGEGRGDQGGSRWRRMLGRRGEGT